MRATYRSRRSRCRSSLASTPRGPPGRVVRGSTTTLWQAWHPNRSAPGGRVELSPTHSTQGAVEVHSEATPTGVHLQRQDLLRDALTVWCWLPQAHG